MTIASEVLRMANEAIPIARDLGATLDESFGAHNIEALHDATVRMRSVHPPLTDHGRSLTVQHFGCYLLQVALTTFGGNLFWSKRFEQPVFEWSNGTRHVTMLAWNKVRGLLDGDDGDQLQFHWQGVATEIREGTRDNTVFV